MSLLTDALSTKTFIAVMVQLSNYIPQNRAYHYLSIHVTHFNVWYLRSYIYERKWQMIICALLLRVHVQHDSKWVEYYYLCVIY